MWGLLGNARKAEHRFCRDNLSAFMDGQLAVRDRERVSRHLDRCQACQQELAGLQRTVSLLRALPRVKAPRSFAIPRSTPAPSLPIWMQPWAYGALRVASAATAVLLVVALAGNALVLPATHTSDAVRMLAAKSAELPEAAARGEVEVAPAAQPLAEEAPMLGAPMGTSVAEENAPAAALAAPSESALPPGGVAALSPTLSAEEAARATSAPLGMGGGAAEAGTPPTVEDTQVADATQGVAPMEPGQTATPPPLVAESYAVATPAPALPAPGDANLAAPPEDGEPERAGTYGLRPWDGALLPLRERASGYPWGWWALGSGSLLAVLLAATLWVHARRSRWP